MPRRRRDGNREEEGSGNRGGSLQDVNQPVSYGRWTQESLQKFLLDNERLLFHSASLLGFSVHSCLYEGLSGFKLICKVLLVLHSTREVLLAGDFLSNFPRLQTALELTYLPIFNKVILDGLGMQFFLSSLISTDSYLQMFSGLSGFTAWCYATKQLFDPNTTSRKMAFTLLGVGTFVLLHRQLASSADSPLESTDGVNNSDAVEWFFSLWSRSDEVKMPAFSSLPSPIESTTDGASNSGVGEWFFSLWSSKNGEVEEVPASSLPSSLEFNY